MTQEPPPKPESLSEVFDQWGNLSPEDFSRKLARLENLGFQNEREIVLFCEIWQEYCRNLIHGSQEQAWLHPLAAGFQLPMSLEHRKFLHDRGLPGLRELFLKQCHLRDLERADDWLFLVKILVGCDSPQQAGLIVAKLIREGYGADSFVWGVIFDQAVEDREWGKFLIENLAEYPPDLFCGICFLDLANELAGSDAVQHPFQSQAGIKRLRDWLESDDPGEESYALSATEALKFLSGTPAQELLKTAIDHDSEEIRLLAAEILLNHQENRAFPLLVELAANPATSTRAVALLKSCGREADIPPETADPEFQALADFCGWLKDPENFGEVADEIDPIARIRMDWPPAGDERTFYLFRYLYHSDCHEGEQPDEIGVGVVGSRTVSLVGFTNPSMSPRQILAMHCCWELQQQGDPRAPLAISVEEGERLIDEYLAERRE